MSCVKIGPTGLIVGDMVAGEGILLINECFIREEELRTRVSGVHLLTACGLDCV